MSSELMVTPCEHCDCCSGQLSEDCPRRAYWFADPSPDSYDWTGLSEDEARRRAANNPGGTADAAVRAADGGPRLKVVRS